MGRKELMDSGRIALKQQAHLRIPTYKDEYRDGFSGWHIETGKSPKPLGAYWLKIELSKNYDIVFDFIKAR
jgi:hypothetical protein